MRIKFFLFLIFILSGISYSRAQVAEGKFLLGGSATFNHTKATNEIVNMDQRTDNVSADVLVGKFISSSVAVGLIGQYSHVKSGQSKYNGFGIGVFGRKYKSLGAKFYLIGQGDVMYLHSSATAVSGSTNKLLSNGGVLDLFPGVSYALTPKFQMELMIPGFFSMSYITQKNETGGSVTSKQNQFSAGLNLDRNVISNLGIGFKFIL
ncbi:MAG: hypothetical protein J0H55_05625 [Chitinophagaceae bacterium]|nr:hypothetical protein [Chitinophagaceae bacterium]